MKNVAYNVPSISNFFDLKNQKETINKWVFPIEPFQYFKCIYKYLRIYSHFLNNLQNKTWIIWSGPLLGIFIQIQQFLKFLGTLFRSCTALPEATYGKVLPFVKLKNFKITAELRLPSFVTDIVTVTDGLVFN